MRDWRNKRRGKKVKTLSETWKIASSNILREEDIRRFLKTKCKFECHGLQKLPNTKFILVISNGR